MQFKEPKKQKEGKEKFDIQLALLRSAAITKSKLERAKED